MRLQQLKNLKEKKRVLCHMEGTSKYHMIDSTYLQLLFGCAQETLRETHFHK